MGATPFRNTGTLAKDAVIPVIKAKGMLREIVALLQVPDMKRHPKETNG